MLFQVRLPFCLYMWQSMNHRLLSAQHRNLPHCNWGLHYKARFVIIKITWGLTLAFILIKLDYFLMGNIVMVTRTAQLTCSCVCVQQNDLLPSQLTGNYDFIYRTSHSSGELVTGSVQEHSFHTSFEFVCPPRYALFSVFRSSITLSWIMCLISTCCIFLSVSIIGLLCCAALLLADLTFMIRHGKSLPTY